MWRRPGTAMTPMAIAGWLFADLLAGFVLIVLGSQPAAVADRPVTPVPTPVTSGSRPAPTPSARPVGLSRAPIRLTVTGTGTARVRSEVRRATGGRLTGRRAGLVMTFGAGSPEAGTRLAEKVNRGLRAAFPGLLKGAVVRAYHDQGLPGGEATVEIYLFTR
ncbi:hypothetical protein ACOZ38_13045 [Sphaerisporangium viridialbum]|uniref:hypothetical protein n=1 Tax=Sphaerisporangium viridialbum TaxID=46189 RepID=UPI003C7298E8